MKMETQLTLLRLHTLQHLNSQFLQGNQRRHRNINNKIIDINEEFVRFDYIKENLFVSCTNWISRTTISPAWFWEPVSSATSILLVIGLLIYSYRLCGCRHSQSSIDQKSRARKFTTFQRLDFTCDDVLDSLKEENIIGKGGVGIVYKGVMPNNEHVEQPKEDDCPVTTPLAPLPRLRDPAPDVARSPTKGFYTWGMPYDNRQRLIS
ncbi:hypothetical protein LXL04_007584 [Taraxacum kok-saghyz]